MKKTITFELSGDDVRDAVAAFIEKHHSAVRFANSDIHFAAIIDPTDATKITGVSASLTAVEEEKKSGTVRRKQVPASPTGQAGAGTEGSPSGA